MSAPKPTRLELATRFFPEISKTTNATDAKDAIEMNTRACEVILLDLLKRHDAEFDNLGPGCLILNLRMDAAGYFTLEALADDFQTAIKHGDTAIKDFLEGVVREVEANTNREKVLIMLIDKSSQRLLTLSRDMPASEIQEMQYALAAGMGAGADLSYARFLANKPKGFGK